MDNDTPYRPPSSDVSGATPGSSDGEVAAGIVEVLRKTRPWVLFLSILTFIGCGFMFLLGLFMVVAGGAAEFQELFGGLGGVTVGGLYFLFGLLYLVPGLHLLRYAGAIKKLNISPTTAGLQAALEFQHKFWRFVGIVMAALMGVYALIFVGAFLIAFIAG